jgi:hypothetical protein
LSDVIAFPARRNMGTSHATLDQKRSAEILFFTGVRIERHVEDSTPVRPSTKRPAPSRERTAPRRRRN